MRTKIKVTQMPLIGGSPASYPAFYETDLVNVENTIRHWYAGDTVLRDPIERIQTWPNPGGETTWLISNDLEIGMNVNGTKIVPDFTVDWLCENIYSMDMVRMEEILNHVQMIKELYPDITVWPTPVWFLFPTTRDLDELIIPF